MHTHFVGFIFIIYILVAVARSVFYVFITYDEKTHQGEILWVYSAHVVQNAAELKVNTV